MKLQFLHHASDVLVHKTTYGSWFCLALLYQGFFSPTQHALGAKIFQLKVQLKGHTPMKCFTSPSPLTPAPQLDWLQSKSWIYLVAFFFMHLSPSTKMQICWEQVLFQTCFCVSSAWRWLANPLTWVKFIRAFKTPWAPSPGWSLLLRGGRKQNSFAKLFISWLKSPQSPLS